MEQRKKPEAIKAFDEAQEALSSKAEIAEAQELLFSARTEGDREAAKELLDEVESKFSELKETRDAAEARLTSVLEAEAHIDLSEYDKIQNEVDQQLRVSQEASDRAIMLAELAEDTLTFAIKDAEGKTDETISEEAIDLVEGVMSLFPNLDENTVKALTAQARRMLDSGEDYENVDERLTKMAKEVSTGKYAAGRYYTSPASRLIHGK